MKISVLYIAKNEAKVLLKSLRSLSVIGNIYEVIVVDTGSVDETVQIAKDFGAKVFSFPWQDDFSRARNFALKKARGDFIVFLDADEYFVNKNIGALERAILKAQKNKKDALALHMIHIESISLKKIGEIFALRVFRREQISYRGAIHETLYRDDEKPLNIDFVDKKEVTLLHTGYEESLSKKKAQRNLKFLLRELDKNTEKSRLYPYLAETYEALADEDKAVFYAKLAVLQGRHNESYESRSYRVLLRILAKHEERQDERLEIAKNAYRDYKELPEFAAEYAECLAKNYEFKKAIAIMQEALLPKNFNPLDISLFTDDFRNLAQKRLASWEKIVKKAQDISISSCLIGKNVIKDLPLYMEGAKVFSDEIIYVDTGSVDNSKDFMQEQQAKVFFHPWQGDFSRAKNFALKQAKCEWIVFLDADENFYFPKRVRYILATLTQKENTVYEVPLINVDEDDDYKETHRFRAVRIFPNRKGFSYEGKIHETLKFNNMHPQIDYIKDLPVRHTGYSSKRIYAKLTRNVKVLEEELKRKEHPEVIYYLPECYLGLGKYEEASIYTKKALASKWHSPISDSDLYHTGIMSYKKLKDFSNEKRMLQEAIKKFPRLPDFWGLYGIFCYEEKKERKKTFALLEKALHLFKEQQDLQVATRLHAFLDKIYTFYAKLLLDSGKENDALKYSQEALRLNGKYRLARSVYKDSLKTLDAKTKAKLIQNFLPKNKDSLRELIIWASEEEEWDLKDIYEKELKEDFGIEEADELSYLYDLQQKREWQKLYNAILKELGTRVPEIFLLILELSNTNDLRVRELVEEVRTILPKEAEDLFSVYLGEKKLAEQHLNTYHLFIPFIASKATKSVKEQYVALAQSLSDEQIIKIGAAFQREENFQEALSLYSLIPATSKMVDGHFWHIVGVCLYQLGDKEGAKECFLKSLSLNYDVPEIHAYLAWIEEGGEENN